jgi:hypothetical protein
MGPALTVGLTIGFIILSFVVAAALSNRVNQSTHPSEEMLENHIKAKAVVQQIAQTGTWINNNPQVAFVLEVHPPSDPSYQVETNKVVQVIDVPQIQPGKEIDVLIDPDDNQKVTLALR